MVNRKKLFLAVVSSLAISASISAQAEAKRFKVDSNSADLALIALAKSAGVQVVLSSKSAKSIQLPELDGEYTLDQALKILLKGTDLSYSITADNAILVTDKSPKKTDKKEDVEEVVVTGSRIRNSRPASPVQIYTDSDIKAMGVDSAEDFLRRIPQNFSAVNIGTSADEKVAGSVDYLGIGTANLRGIGSSKTLVLVNGRRRAGSAVTNGTSVNLNGIPMDSIERVEIILDNASAIYGSDAMGGVINFITKKSAESKFQTTARYENSVNGGDAFKLSQSMFFSWDSGEVSAVLTKRERKEVSAQKAGIQTMNYASYGGNGLDLRLAVRDVDLYGIGGHLGEGSTASNHTGEGLTYADFSNGTVTSGNVQHLDIQDGVKNSVQPSTESENVTLSFRQDITDSISFHMNAMWGEYYNLNSDSIPTVWRKVGSDNIHYPTGVPEDVSIYTRYSFYNEVNSGRVPYFGGQSTQTNWSVSPGVDIDIPFRDWRVDVGYNYNESGNKFNRLNFDYDVLEKAFVGHTVLVNGLETDPTNGSNWTRNESYLISTWLPAHPDAVVEYVDVPDELHFNPFGDGSTNSQELLDKLFINEEGIGTPSTISGINVGANGSLYDLPAGSLGAAISFRTRLEELDYGASEKGERYDGVLDRQVTELGVEFEVPLVDDSMDIPGVESLSINLAALYSEYELDGQFTTEAQLNNENETFSFSQVSPKFGMVWYPHNTLKVRATFGESFRAPAMTTMFMNDGGYEYVRTDFIDPLHPEAGPLTVTYGFKGNPGIKPETSKNTTYGFDWTPDGALSGLTVSITRTNINQENNFASSGSLAPEEWFSMPQLVERDPVTGVLTKYYYSTVNLAKRQSKTTDLRFGYQWDTDYGLFNLTIDGTYVSYIKSQTRSTDPWNSTDGLINSMENKKGAVWLTWSKDNYGSTLRANYSSSYWDTDTDWSYSEVPVDSFTYLDFSSWYETEGGWKLKAGATNVLNTKPPFLVPARRAVPWDARRYDARGRVVYFELSKSYNLF